MKQLATLTFLLVYFCTATPVSVQKIDFDPMLNVFKESLQGIVDSINELKKVVADLGRQTMLQQYAMEERSRINSASGIKSIRSQRKGLKNYETPTFSEKGVFSIHDHSNHYNTIGMGEVSVLMNGVNFCTRHNDYKLVMPSTTSREFRATEPIPFPDVPPSVKGTLEEQVDEMAEWFNAFKAQNYSVRDYRKYFTPVLCYMEGVWTVNKKFQEPFQSDRHSLEANSWHELQEKVKFSSYSGTKNGRENLAYLPTTIQYINDTTGVPIYAQWNYRILCKPTKKDIPLSMLKYVDDLATRMRDGKNVRQGMNSRSARFKLYDEHRSATYQIMDEVFYGIPGMDNLPHDNLTQVTFSDLDMYDVAENDENLRLKTGYYHRQFKFNRKGAMGLLVNRRGFNDENLWVAQTTQSEVAPVGMKTCRKVKRKTRKGYNWVCKRTYNRFSYAIPLEIIYLTPLLSWNPHNLKIHQAPRAAYGKMVTDINGFNLLNAISDGESSRPTRKEDGGRTPYQGVDQRHFYMTPMEMFQKKKTGGSKDPADTTRGVVRVMDRNNQTRSVVASGTRITLGGMRDVGDVRLRYPIAPVADEASGVWKELNALKDYVYAMQGMTDMQLEVEPNEVFFKMSTSANSTVPDHTHTFSIPYRSFKDVIKTGRVFRVTTDQTEGHTHDLKVSYSMDTKTFWFAKCDKQFRCFDNHPREVFLTTKSIYTQL